MKVQQFDDNAIDEIARANADAFFSDLAAGTGQGELAKNLREVRAMADTDHFFEEFELRMQSVACSGRSGNSTPRLRSEREPRTESESDWRPGDSVEKDLTDGDGEPFAKRAGSRAARIEKNANGSTCEYDAAGSLIRCYIAGVDPSSFENLEKACHCGS